MNFVNIWKYAGLNYDVSLRDIDQILGKFSEGDGPNTQLKNWISTLSPKGRIGGKSFNGFRLIFH